MIRAAAALTALAALATPALAEVACPPERAVYGHEETGFRVSFRPMQPWEQVAMTLAVFDVELHDGRNLWGTISTGMGTSRDIGQIYADCPRPGPDDAWDEARLEECRVWEGVVYGLSNDRLTPFPVEGERAPRSLIFSDLGRQLRYAIFESPGEEPWDQLFLTACAPG